MMNEWEEEAWNTTAPLPPFDFDSPERAPAPVQQNIPAFGPNTRPGYRPAPPQQQQPIMGGPYSLLIGSNWQNPSFGPAQGAQEYTQGLADTATGVGMFGVGLVTDTGNTLKEAAKAMVDPETYEYALKSGLGMHGPRGMGEFWGGMALPNPIPSKVKGKLYNTIRDRPGYKSVRQDLKGVGRTVYDKRPDGGRDFHWGRPGMEHGNLVADFMRTQKAAAKKKGHLSPEGLNQDLWRIIQEDPYVFVRNADQAKFSAQKGFGGWYDPSTRRVTVPRVKGKWSKNLNRHEDAHVIWDKQINKGLHREGIQHASTPGPGGSPQAHVNYPVFRGPERSNPKLYNYMNELNSYTVGAKSVTQGLRDWGRFLSEKDGLYKNHGGRAAGYATQALGEAMYGAQDMLPRVIRTGIMMNDSPSKEGISAENSEIDRTKFYTP